jgi:two-component system, NtrC family, response regulator AtoC
MKGHVDLQSLVDSHELPFVVIDKEFRILALALNRAYTKAYGVSAGAIGSTCFSVIHGETRPCLDAGLECPYQQVFTDLRAHSCLHAHPDAQGHNHWVRVSVYPLRRGDGEVCLGKSYQEIAHEDEADLSEPGARMAGQSPSFLTMIEQLQLAAGSRLPVLLLGETGTGKELAAKFIHRHSERRDGPFQTVDCTTLSESLVESELFGHERGSFTGSVARRRGLFELADGGTLFLDEIGELPLGMQAKLLRALESGEYRRVGGQETRHVNVRALCATNRHLWELVRAGGFREDLYHRIACMTVHLPPLRERLQDIPLLSETLLEHLQHCNGRRHRLTREAADLLQARTYTGNIRELRNILYGAAALATGQEIDGGHIRAVLRHRAVPAAAPAPAASPLPPATGDLPGAQSSLSTLESEHIRDVLQQVKGHRAQAAKILGIGNRTLYRKIKLYGLG